MRLKQFAFNPNADSGFVLQPLPDFVVRLAGSNCAPKLSNVWGKTTLTTENHLNSKEPRNG
jgi:hypothetical protein